jgi:cell surface protein SprA
MCARKEPAARPTAYPWDIENFDFSYAYSEINRRNIDIEYDKKITYRGGIGYNFSHQPQKCQAILKFYQDQTDQAILTFTYLPRSFSFRTDMFREYNERLIRNKSAALIKIDTNYIKRWDWSRMFDLNMILPNRLKVEFNATANAFIDEPPGAVDRNKPNYQAVKRLHYG